MEFKFKALSEVSRWGRAAFSFGKVTIAIVGWVTEIVNPELLLEEGDYLSKVHALVGIV